MKKVVSFVILVLLSVCFLSSVSAVSEADELFVTDTTVTDDGNFTVVIGLSSNKMIEHIEFDIIIPDGFVLDYFSVDGQFFGEAELVKSNDKYSFIFYSADGQRLREGTTLLSLVLFAEHGTPDGKYEVITENVKFIDTDKNTYFLSNVSGKIQLHRNSDLPQAGQLPQQKCNHEFDGWRVTKAPTYETEGEREKVCKKCNAVCKTLTIAKIQKRNIVSADVSYTENCVYTGKALTPDISLKYKGMALSEGKDYTVTYSNNTSVGTGTITVKGIGAYEGEKTVSFSIKPGRVTGVKLKSRTSDSITLSWNKVKGADMYAVYVYKSGSWKKAGESTKNYLKVKNLSSGKKYKFKVRAESRGVKGSKSALFGIYTKPNAVKIKNIKSYNNGEIKITWSELKSCDGYRIYVKYPDSSKYKLLKTIKTSTVTSYVTKRLTAKGEYSFKIRSYINSEETKILSSYSKVKHMRL